jgi:hypothetical protein
MGNIVALMMHEQTALPSSRCPIANACREKKGHLYIQEMLLACVRAIETRSTDTTRSLSLEHPSDSNQFVATFFPLGLADVRWQMIEIKLKFRSAAYRCHLVNSGGLTATIKSLDRHRQIFKAGRMNDRRDSTG